MLYTIYISCIYIQITLWLPLALEVNFKFYINSVSEMKTLKFQFSILFSHSWTLEINELLTCLANNKDTLSNWVFSRVFVEHFKVYFVKHLEELSNSFDSKTRLMAMLMRGWVRTWIRTAAIDKDGHANWIQIWKLLITVAAD